jgi:2-oxoglutarate ferredoxin oxidoreductase subunit delta
MELNEQGKAVVVREKECINCGFCELHCPDFAIMVRPKVDEEIPAVCRAVLEKAAQKTANAEAAGGTEKKSESGKNKG